jgi:hypothetical protein
MTKYVTLSPHLHAILKQILDKACVANELRVSEHEELVQLFSNLATEATLQSVETNTTGVARTPGIIRPNNTSGNVNTVAATFYSVSVANVGLAAGTVLGATINPGEVLNFSADALNNFFNSFAYDATGTEFIIIYVS